jgi:hypothetical protein
VQRFDGTAHRRALEALYGTGSAADAGNLREAG